MTVLALYSSATGMEAQQVNLDTIANNMANVNSTGFKRNKAVFEDLLYHNPQALGGESGAGGTVPTGIQIGNGTEVSSTMKIFTQGQLSQTSNNYDVAIQGDGFFEVTKPDGSSAYTRDGSFKVDSTGQIVTSEGYPLVGFGTVPAGSKIIISETGIATVQSEGSSQTFNIQLSRFANPGGLKSLGGNLYEVTDASGEAETGSPGLNGFGTLKQGWLELSNVNVVEEMVNMIIAQRAYELNSKSIQTSAEMMAQIAQLKR